MLDVVPSVAYLLRMPDARLRSTNGAAVRALREALGIKHGHFARDVEVSTGYLSNIEAGRKQPDPAVTKRIATRLGVPLDAITYPTPAPAGAERRPA
jgi:transcriptional regulator with XRE-family HTH domain